MTEAGDAPRLRKGERTRLAILQAARDEFQRLGYDRASIRAVAAAASIDPSMVMRYYGSKEGLFAAAVDVDLRLPDLGAGPRASRGRRLVAHFLQRWEGSGDDVLVLLLRSAATNDAAAARLRAVFAQQLLVMVRAATPHGDAERRAGLVASQMLGLAFTRYVLQLPVVASMSAEDLVDDLGPTIQRFLVGRLDPA